MLCVLSGSASPGNEECRTIYQQIRVKPLFRGEVGRAGSRSWHPSMHVECHRRDFRAIYSTLLRGMITSAEFSAKIFAEHTEPADY